MADEESEVSDDSDNQTSLKEYWAGLQSNISAAGKRVADSSKKAAKAASDWGADMSDKMKAEKDRRQRDKDKRESEYTENLKQDEKFKEILPVGE